MKKVLAMGICLFFLGIITLCAQESITLTTYYPAPFGVYQELRSSRMAIGANYISQPDYCWQGTCTNQINASTDLLVEDALRVDGNVGLGVDPRSPSPDGLTKGNMDVNDIYLRAANNGSGQWVSKLSAFVGAPKKAVLTQDVVPPQQYQIMTAISQTIAMPANGGPFRVLATYSAFGGGSCCVWVEDDRPEPMRFAQACNNDGNYFSATDISPVTYSSGQTVTFHLKTNTRLQGGNSLNIEYLPRTWFTVQLIKTEE